MTTRQYNNLRFQYDGYTFECDCQYEPGRPAITGGPPDNWAPEEPAELYIDRIQFVYGGCAVGPDLHDWINKYGPSWENLWISLEDVILLQNSEKEYD